MSKTEPYLEHIDSKEIKKLVQRLYEDQPDHVDTNKDMFTAKKKEKGELNTDNYDRSHDYIVSEIDKLLADSQSINQHAEPEPTESPLPEFPATEKPKKIEKPKRPDKKKGIFGFFKK